MASNLVVVAEFPDYLMHLEIHLRCPRPQTHASYSLSPLTNNNMSTLSRTIRNFWKVGWRDAAHQMQHIGDTKYGTLIGIDRYGNKYYENLQDELPLRTRWVDYKEYHYDAGQMEPGWHAWMSYMVDKAPAEDPILKTGVRPWELKEHRPNFTQSRAAFKTYSTVLPKITAWNPENITPRQ